MGDVAHVKEVAQTREEFMELYFANKHQLIETIKTKLLQLSESTIITEIVKMIYRDNDTFTNQIMCGNFTLDLRMLHVETVFLIWVFLREVKRVPDLRAEQIIALYQI
ncbi:hypothetical protein EIN_033920 [Entamoeba invadens IP1]|uniref:Uncharacterized protein n=1 Tax=Entamoeba invadens IP1 TaxID=370355 RepID=A0A0A1U475_ENTIV|nr:hypothetical protein EIN_033920 [Entamoeba invadens IP1]ELP86491.1 hypothetical protein EIN_033920 [Entamoeba invadens IP1]|eukprot:XP_004185837.1 hypothetical protein EIN_033920 [Entamoeba invadens IP1]